MMIYQKVFLLVGVCAAINTQNPITCLTSGYFCSEGSTVPMPCEPGKYCFEGVAEQHWNKWLAVMAQEDAKFENDNASEESTNLHHRELRKSNGAESLGAKGVLTKVVVGVLASMLFMNDFTALN
eukprot:gene363-953_t